MHDGNKRILHIVSTDIQESNYILSLFPKLRQDNQMSVGCFPFSLCCEESENSDIVGMRLEQKWTA